MEPLVNYIPNDTTHPNTMAYILRTENMQLLGSRLEIGSFALCTSAVQYSAVSIDSTVPG